MDGVYWVIVSKATGKHLTKGGQSSAPHLYVSEGRANAQCNSKHFNVVPVNLTELKSGALT